MENLLKKSNGKWEQFYQREELQKRKKQEYYAKQLCEKENFEKFISIKSSERKTFKTINHKGQADISKRIKRYGYLNYNEKLLARAMFNQKEETPFGKIIEYEVPLKARKQDKQDDNYDKDGDIDLISKKGETIYLIELKRKKSSDETFLRALLEICTYYQRLNIQAFKTEFPHKKIELLILLQEDSYAYNQAVNLKKTVCLNNLYEKLAKELKVKIGICSYKISPQRDNKEIFNYDKNNLKASKITFKEEINVEFKLL